MKGAIIASLSSGSGKTSVTAALLGLCKRQNINILAAKSGPDFIDPHFLSAASDGPCLNLDAYAMSPQQIKTMLLDQQASHILIEGAMGLFDGTDGGKGSCQYLAQILNLPIILVINVKAQAQMGVIMARAMIDYMDKYHPATPISGVIFNEIASPRHQELIYEASKYHKIPLLGFIGQMQQRLNSRHLGLIQALEMEEEKRLSPFVDEAINKAEQGIDFDRFINLFCKISFSDNDYKHGLFQPLGQKISIAYDKAFAFHYHHLWQNWRDMGAELSFFSPLNDDAPAKDSDAIFLAGGYPELYAETLSNNDNFKRAMRHHAHQTHIIYGECGGYMCLGQTLFDQKGVGHEMLGLLPHDTSFVGAKRRLAYHHIKGLPGTYFAGQNYTAHEFHYSQSDNEHGPALFKSDDGSEMGLCHGSVFGSYAHIISCREQVPC